MDQRHISKWVMGRDRLSRFELFNLMCPMFQMRLQMVRGYWDMELLTGSSVEKSLKDFWTWRFFSKLSHLSLHLCQIFLFINWSKFKMKLYNFLYDYSSNFMTVFLRNPFGNHQNSEANYVVMLVGHSYGWKSFPLTGSICRHS